MSEVSSRTELRRCKDQWVLSGDAYVLHRAEKAIPFAKLVDNRMLCWPATEEAAVELLWLRQRFPFFCHHEELLRSDAAKHNLQVIKARKIANGQGVSGDVMFQPGLAPRSYQMQAAMLWRTVRGLLCADDLGLGKTISALAGLASREMLPAVVVTPANLTLQWKSQIDLFTSGVTSHIVKSRKVYDPRIVVVCKSCGEAATHASVALRECTYCRHKHFKAQHADVYIISYDKLRDWASDLAQFVVSVVFDECQDLRLSNSEKYAGAQRLSRAAQWRLGLSATPTHNWGGEMYNIMDILCPNTLGEKQHFKSTWCYYPQNYVAGGEPPLRDPEAFSKYLISKNMMIRRTRADVGRELPPEQRVVIEIEHSQEIFDRMTKGAKELARIMLRLTDSAFGHGSEMNAAGRFREMMYRATGIAKAAYVANFVKLLLETGEPVMLFGWHTDVYEIWNRQLAEYNPAMYTGSETPAKKEHSKQLFTSGETNLFICSLGSGRGLDGMQQRCRTNVFGELAWSPAVIDQAIGRSHRDGQARHVTSYFPYSEDGLDPVMMEILSLKKVQVDGVIQRREASSVLSQRDADDHLRKIAQAFIK